MAGVTLKAGRGKITLRIEKGGEECSGSLRGNGKKKKEKALQCDLISCLR